VAADLFGSDTELDEIGIADTLTGQGCHPDLANIIVDYLPSAFAEPALERLGVSRLSTYRRKLTDGRTVEYNWQDDRIWLAAREFVQTQISNGDWAKYQHIGLRSAELRAVSDALNAGSEMAGGTCAVAPLSILPPDSPFLPRRRQWRWFRA
jgi:hypothetical protein